MREYEVRVRIDKIFKNIFHIEIRVEYDNSKKNVSFYLAC